MLNCPCTVAGSAALDFVYNKGDAMDELIVNDIVADLAKVGITATRLSNVGKERGQMDKCAGADELKLTVADTGKLSKVQDCGGCGWLVRYGCRKISI